MGASDPVQGLSGPPGLSFHHRRNLYHAKQSGALACATLALYSSAALQLWRLLSQAGRAALLAYCAACTALLAWRAGPWHASFACHREWPAAVLRFGTFGLGMSIPGRLLAQQLLDPVLPVGAAGGAAVEAVGVPVLEALGQLAFLAVASGTVALAYHSLVWRVRLGLGLAVSMAMAACALPHNEAMCAAALAGGPGAARATHSAFALLSAAGCLAPLRISRFVSLDAAGECAALAAFCQVGLGLLAPLLWDALASARLFRAHQHQRRRAGLPPERGLHASFFRFVDGVTLEGAPLLVSLVAWILLSCVLDWASFLVAAPQPAAPA